MSRPRLKISSFVIERLNKFHELSSGRLYGTLDLADNTLLILGFNISSQKKVVNEEREEEVVSDKVLKYDILPNLPSEVDLCGIFVASSEVKAVDNDTWAKQLADIAIDNPVLLQVDLESRDIKAQFSNHNKLEDTDYEVVDESYLLDSFLIFRLIAQVPLFSDFEYEAISESFSDLREKVQSCGVVFQILDRIYFLDDTDGISGASHDSYIEDILVEKEHAEETIKIKGKVLERHSPKFVEVKMYLKGLGDSVSKFAPVLSYTKKECKSMKLNIHLDSLSMVNRRKKLGQLYEILVESAVRGFKAHERCVLEQLEGVGEGGMSCPSTLHYLPRDVGHFVSATYPIKAEEDDLKSLRETLHIQFHLLMDRPIFRRGSAYQWSSPAPRTGSTLLLNPHEAVGSSGVKDGSVATVRGLYAYHHYNQDRFDDNGWGCAYRSFQTVFSWFRLQGYTEKAIPTHKMIQQCLVDLGDKPSSFVGSTNWIGSTEVSFCLDSMLGVSSRILSVSSGEEMSTKGGELSHHFMTQGTPVMIGGGVLAHTILGVDLNRRSGVVKFLILDPHYTGAEDLQLVVAKGWCGWKGVEFWKKGSFYNMCLPIRPKCI